MDGNNWAASPSVLLQAGALDPVALARTILERIAGYPDRAIVTAWSEEEGLVAHPTLPHVAPSIEPLISHDHLSVALAVEAAIRGDA